jgi:hypothetical protein
MEPHPHPNEYSMPSTDMVVYESSKVKQQRFPPVASFTTSTSMFTSPRPGREVFESLVLPTSTASDESKELIKYKSNFTTSRCLQGAPRRVDPAIMAAAEAQGVDLANTRYQGDLNATTIANLQAS